MKLNDLVQHIPHTGASDAEISAITYDSRKAAAGSLFVCLVGAWLDGHTYAASAYKNGCRAFLCEHALDLPADAAQIITADTRAALAVIGADFYGNPADQLHIIGITATANTTPESLELHRLFRKMLDANVHHVVLEVSSQALRHNRVDGIPFEVVAFTNLSEDHIGPGEHPDFEDYKNAKHRLFVDYQAREMIYNADDDTSEFMRIGFGGHQTSYGIERAADYHGTALAQFRSETALGIDFLCEHGGSSTAVRVLSPGEFSASDALCAIALCGAFGVSPAQAAQTLAHTPVQGRFEVVEGLPGRTFIVDYSHNGLALTSALKTLRAYNPHKLLCVFGSVGGRTQVRRRELAEAAGAFADYSIITSDNPDFEPPEDVIKEIASHMPEGAPYTCIIDRRDAIRAAIGMAEDGDIILFAGKGHEDYQLIEGKKVHFVEREIIQEICRKKQ